MVSTGSVTYKSMSGIGFDRRRVVSRLVLVTVGASPSLPLSFWSGT